MSAAQSGSAAEGIDQMARQLGLLRSIESVDAAADSAKLAAQVASAQQLAAIGAAFPDLVFVVDAEGQAACMRELAAAALAARESQPASTKLADARVRANALFANTVDLASVQQAGGAWPMAPQAFTTKLVSMLQSGPEARLGSTVRTHLRANFRSLTVNV
jgi:hypothetical protein